MLNKEKYKDRLEEILSVTIAVSESGDIFQCTNTVNCKDCIFFGYDCAYKASKWLNSECNDNAILTYEEKAYLSAVIKPFRDKVQYIAKYSYASEWITIKIIDDSKLTFPSFEKGAMYKGMEEAKEYTLEKLGLDND